MSEGNTARLNAAMEILRRAYVSRGRRWAFAASLLSIAVGSCVSEPTGVVVDEDPPQLLLDGDVEIGPDAEGVWRSGGASLQDYQFEWSTEDAGDGGHSLLIRSVSDTAPPGAFAYWAQSVVIDDPVGVMFELSASVRLDGISGKGVAIAVRGDDTRLDNGFAEAFATTQALQVIRGTEDWQRFSVGLTAVPGTVDRITIYLIHLSGARGTVLFDDVALEVIDVTSGTARSYLDVILNVMENNSINRYQIDWPEFREQAYQDAGGARRTPDTYPAIERIVERLGDHHSFFRWPAVAASSPRPSPPGLPAAPARADPMATLLDSDLGYVEVPAFGGGGQAANDLATHYHRLIESVDTLGTCGWVVDLRGNTGGNMWPMIAGVGPVLGEGIVGYFVDPDSVVISWSYEDGTSVIGSSVAARATDPYTLQHPDPPVAVLTDSLTASSGEGTAIAFRGRPSARSFGKPTWGISTANQGYTLSDGARLFLTVSTMADRAGQLYGEEVTPDEIVGGAKTQDPATDAPLRAAMDWLHAQPTCTGPQ